jgi:hypothetical protein
MLFKRLTMKEANSNYIFPTELHISLEDIEQILGMKFEFFIDDLGETYDALIETNNGVRIAFVCRKGHNYKYIIVGVQEYFSELIKTIELYWRMNYYYLGYL